MKDENYEMYVECKKAIRILLDIQIPNMALEDAIDTLKHIGYDAMNGTETDILYMI